MPRAPNPQLAVIDTAPTSSAPLPPAHLDDVGRELWLSITSSYEFADLGSYEVLAQACAARQRAARCAALIDRDGEMIRGTTGPRSHPLIRDEIQARVLTCGLLRSLGLNLESIAGR
jgi:hypothetical protein